MESKVTPEIIEEMKKEANKEIVKDGLINQIKSKTSYSELTLDELKSVIKDVFFSNPQHRSIIYTGNGGAAHAIIELANAMDLHLSEDEILYIGQSLDVGGYSLDADFYKQAEEFLKYIKQHEVVVDHDNKTIKLIKKEMINTQATAQMPYDPVRESKQFRKDLDNILQVMKNSSRDSEERHISITRLKEAIMWLGMDLKAMKEEGLSDEENPYPNSYNPDNKIVEPTADDLTL